MNFLDGKKGWSDRCLWYNYKINSLLRQEIFDKAMEQACIAESVCPKQWLFFIRLQAQALKGLGETNEAKGLYEKLCKKKKPEWWLLHEYGNLLKEQGEKESAHKILCMAALSNAKLEMMVRLFSDIAEIYTENGDFIEARAHFYLEKYIRHENGWPLPSPLRKSIEDLDNKLLSEPAPISKQEALLVCKSFWKKNCGTDIPKSPKKNWDLVGKLIVPRDKSFCFVNTKDGLSAICFPKDFQDDIQDGDTVIFDAIPSFDKKKNRDSWKAIKIKKHTAKKV